MKRFRYGLIGVGPVGCVVATHLVQSGAEVVVYSKDPEVTHAMKAGPIKVHGVIRAEAKFNNIHTNLTDFLEEKPDIIIFAVKSFNNRTLIDEIIQSGGLGKAVVVSCQNGLSVDEPITEAFGRAQSLRMVMNLGCKFSSKSEIEVKFFRPHILSKIKEVDEKIINQIVGDLNKANFSIEARSDYQRDVFKKVILNSSLGTICTLTGLTMRAAMDSPDIESVVRTLICESGALARAAKIDLSESFIDEAMRYLQSGSDHMPSISLDIAHGRQTENEDQCGALVNLGDKLGVDMPVTKAMYYLMRDLEKRSISKFKINSKPNFKPNSKPNFKP
ncbi:MAG: hypothetical protein A2Z20_09755 [Bdellovibrionales bacterium RBG_16_40_8]|nr:MAG: hypothetical protein A2Z20_09755 [Bdellovibrionales bacterium RBG_16_40_8]